MGRFVAVFILISLFHGSWMFNRTSATEKITVSSIIDDRYLATVHIEVHSQHNGIQCSCSVDT
ncbi:hypothetical protein NECAME_18458 [Necator americanus]|uniref:Uncharacterized protein n=1 Tax=Necator americanus TaxID=51031 RepID=W2SWY2_NECAM|nr:hypothetical protein NECAME_18458 [Necator americanus]ETN73212.1 hypothetical protein NECAME_18458 [Necator americanus]